MSNQKTTQLRTLDLSIIEVGDCLPIVDRDEITSPTGETKKILIGDFASYIINSSFASMSLTPSLGNQAANGLAFDDSVTPSSDNGRCYGSIPAFGNAFSLIVRGFVPSDFTAIGQPRVIFGTGVGNTPVGDPNCAYIGITGNDLLGFIQDGSGNYVQLLVTNFFLNFSSGSFFAALTKDSSGVATLYVNGVPVTSGSGTPGSIGVLANNTVVVGHGTPSSIANLKSIIYEAHVYDLNLSDEDIANIHLGGIDTNNPNLIASYNASNLNVGPTQWLDAVGSNHLLLPTAGAKATNPGKHFTLSLGASLSGYLGNGTLRDVLPNKYVLTSCIVESIGNQPLLSIGSTSTPSYVSASGTGSFWDNRVAIVSASYGVNPLNILSLGAAHADKSIYVQFYSTPCPCTFSFDGYVRV